MKTFKEFLESEIKRLNELEGKTVSEDGEGGGGAIANVTGNSANMAMPPTGKNVLQTVRRKKPEAI